MMVPRFFWTRCTASCLLRKEIFDAKSARKGGIVRRAVRDVDREIGRAAFVAEVSRRGFHLIECGGQYIVICNAGQLVVHT